MTKYILAGGNDRSGSDYGPRFAAEVRRQFSGSVRLISCFFADPEDQWRHKASYWEPWFRTYLGDGLEYELASLEAFLEQAAAADVIYLHGGESNELILERMQALPDAAKAFEGRIVVGSSAGANYLSSKFWTRSKRQTMDGAGLVPYGVMVHYGSVDGGFGGGAVDWPDAERAMRTALGPGVELLKIPEGHLVTLEP